MHEISFAHPARPWTVPVLLHALYIGLWYVLGGTVSFVSYALPPVSVTFGRVAFVFRILLRPLHILAMLKPPRQKETVSL